jgi:signal transduction histidine kinase
VRFGLLKVLSARRSLSVFLAGVVCLACWQIWLTWRLMEQDRSLEQQRARERTEQLADLAVAQLGRSLGDWDLALGEINSLPPSPALSARLPGRATLILISRGAAKVYPPSPLLYVPNPPPDSLPPSRAFDAADALELRDRQYDRALAALQPLVNDPAARPEALLRIARIQRKSGHPEAALETYQLLTSETARNSSGFPYALLAANARCRVLIDLGQKPQAADAARALRAALLEGRWPVRQDVFDYYWNELEGLGIDASQPPRASADLASLVSALYDRWQASNFAGASGKEPRPDSSLLAWNATSQRLAALLTEPGWFAGALKLPLQPGESFQWSLPSSAGSVGPARRVWRSLADVQLPGRLEVSSAASAPGALNARRTAWLAGVALMVALMLVAGYALHRGISQELRVARLQSDFVAAVSHEFRSPLTTLRSITELLAQNRIADESRRQKSYLFLDRETNRLHRLVEDLLDFGRMESGRKQYRMEAHDAFQLTRLAVAEFGEDAAANGFKLETSFAAERAVVEADEEALRRAIRNLLENAVKYSPECRTVWVDGAVADRRVSISVRDCGMGIDPREQRAIFQKFVRGNAAKKAGIKGTGIGLSMVQQISEALGGQIRLESKPGAGSTFTIVLPLAGE